MVEGTTKPSPKYQKNIKIFEGGKMWGICTVIYTSEKNNINNEGTSGLGIQNF